MAKPVKHRGPIKKAGKIYKDIVPGKRQAIKHDGVTSSKRNSDNEVREPYIQYRGAIPVMNQAGSFMDAFWGGEVHVASAAAKITIIKNGISKKELESIKEQSGLDYETLSAILSVSKAKLHSKKGAERFDQNTSERIMLLADVLAYGQSVFEDRDSFNEWLKTSNKALGDKLPIELMDTIYGIDEIKKEIGRIEYGIF